MSKLMLVAGILFAVSGASHAHAQSVETCTSQHEAHPGLSAADLLDQSYVIKAAVPGGVWLQKKNEVFYCNAGVTRDDETMCWKLRVPLKGQNCKEAVRQTVAREIRD